MIIENIFLFIETHFYVLILILVFESFGSLFLKLLLSKFGKKNNPSTSIDVNIFIGILIFSMIMFFIGIFGILSKILVLGLSITIFFLDKILFKRWQEIKSYIKYIKEYKFIFGGFFIFYCFSLLTAFRPVTQFDGMWYQIQIPKMFLQEGNINFNGKLLSYSLQPYLNFFFNLLPLSLPLSIPTITVIISLFQSALVGISAISAIIFGKKNLKFSLITQLLGPLLLGISTTSIFFFGAGYNDLYGMAFGLMASIYVLNIIVSKNIKSDTIIISILLITALALIKVFFAVHAFVLLVLFLTQIFEQKKELFFFTIKILLITGLIFVLPWPIRSYYFTNELLYPIGVDGFDADIYKFIGSGTKENHWAYFIWNRFEKTFVYIFIYGFSPLFAIGMFSPISKNIRKNGFSLWYTAIFSFVLLSFIGILLELRYLMSCAVVITFFGLWFLNEVYLFKSLFVKLTIFILPILFLPLALNFARATDGLKNRGMLRVENMDSYLSRVFVGNMSTYYPSQKSPKPTEFNKNDKLYTVNIHNLIYIENSVFSSQIQYKKFENLKTISDFHEVLKNNNVKYILLKNQVLSEECRLLKIQDYKSCDNNDLFTVEVVDQEQNIKWLKVN